MATWLVHTHTHTDSVAMIILQIIFSQYESNGTPTTNVAKITCLRKIFVQQYYTNNIAEVYCYTHMRIIETACFVPKQLTK